MKPVVIFSLSAIAAIYMVAVTTTIVALQNQFPSAGTPKRTISTDSNLVRPELHTRR